MELREILARVSMEPAVSWKNLQVFPLIQPNGHAPGYALIEDLLESGQARISELHDGGAVPTIKVLNDADVDALIIDGTELRGAKQNRMVNITIIAGKHSETPIPVSCVEAGRWSYRSHQFASSGRTVASKLRNVKARMVAERLASRGEARTDQGAVWEQVDAYACAAHVTSRTRAMEDVFAQRQTSIDEFVAHLKDIDAYGAVVALGGEIIAVDLVDHRHTFKRLWEMLLRGYAMDATLEEKVAKPLASEDVHAWLRGAADTATLNQHKVAGVGDYYAVSGPRLAGGCTVHHGRVAHTALFPACA